MVDDDDGGGGGGGGRFEYCRRFGVVCVNILYDALMLTFVVSLYIFLIESTMNGFGSWCRRWFGDG